MMQKVLLSSLHRFRCETICLDIKISIMAENTTEKRVKSNPVSVSDQDLTFQYHPDPFEPFSLTPIYQMVS